MSASHAAVDVPASGRIVHDPDLCRGCRICEVACSAYHDGMCSAQLSRIHIMSDDLNLEFPAFVCRQCRYPGCYYACPKQDEAMCIDGATGARYINEEQCLRCGRCSAACPFSPSLVWHVETKCGEKYYTCDLCRNRLEGPICVDLCPRNALTIESKGNTA